MDSYADNVPPIPGHLAYLSSTAAPSTHRWGQQAALLTRCATNPAGELLSNNTAELKPRTPLLVVQPDHHGMGQDFTG